MSNVAEATTGQHPIRLRLFPAQHKALVRLAKREGCSLQELIRLAVAKYILTGDAPQARANHQESPVSVS